MEAVEEQIQRVGADKGPRITPKKIEEQVLSETYFSPVQIAPNADQSNPAYERTKRALGCLTICVLVLKNSFTVVGKSACASPENFNEEVGQRIAREDALRQIWALEGYHLRKVLSERAAEVQNQPV